MADQAEPVVPDPTPDPTPAAPAAPSPSSPPAATAGTPSADSPSSPWAQSLEQRFTDPGQRAAVDQYLREEIQPYVTRREQELGEVGTIWEQLNSEETSLPTYLALAEQMYGPEVAQALSNTILDHVKHQNDDVDPDDMEVERDWEDPAQYQEWYDAQPPWVQQSEDNRIAGEEDEAYAAEVQQHAPEISAIGADHLFARYAVATDGDVAAAKERWDAEMGPVIEQARQNPALAESLGLNFGDPAAPAPAAEPGAPNVLGSTAASGGGVPPTEPQYASLDDAMSDFFDTVKGKQAGSYT